jgi:L-threonylcarbamoyladenylate synthase
MTLADDTRAAIDEAAAAIEAGEAVVYPTETVYGLGADATDSDAVDRVFAIKDRPYDKPLSVAFADRETARQYTEPTDRELDFMERFLPGPVTVIVDRQSTLPDVLTGGRSRVGVRIPDNETALALCRAAGPITATSANRSGEPSVTRPTNLSPSIRQAVGAIIDTGLAPGTESTVVDIEANEIHRRGALVDEIESWLADH